MWQVEGHEMRLALNPGDHRHGLAEVRLRLARSMSASRSRGEGRFGQAGRMNEPTFFNRLILRAVLRQVGPMVIRLLSVSDRMELSEFQPVIRLVLGWKNDLGYIVRVYGQEFNSFRRKTRGKALHELRLHRQEKFLYVCDTLHMWE
ncbi:MAG: hypothetical protein ABSG62_22525 [Terracidiphilus sp.]|jgi:hypothetical protein